MADPVTISLAGLTSVALNEGIKFLYGQAGELLKRWRERRDKAKETGSELAATEAVDTNLPQAVFAGQLQNPQIHFHQLDVCVKQLSGVRQELTPFVDGIEDVDASRRDLLDHVDQLRNLLESVYQQRITFLGEDRPQSGTLVTARIDVGRISGDAAALRAKELRSGTVRVEAHADTVETDGKLTGAEIDRIG